jgi:hypothetical protein
MIQYIRPAAHESESPKGKVIIAGGREIEVIEAGLRTEESSLKTYYIWEDLKSVIFCQILYVI